MKIIFPIMAAGLLFGCKSMEWKPVDSVILENFHPQKGVHCESSAMLNMLKHEGYSITEAQIMGAGAVLGFMYELSAFPFLGGRTLAMREHAFENLDIKWHMGTQKEFSSGWEKIHSLLKEDHPVVLRVDMRYLPYLYGGKYGPKYMSFGWHMICIAGIDAEKQTALVTDTTLNGLQKIKLSDLHKARFSDTKVLPPSGEFYWVEKTQNCFNPDWESIALNSLKIIEMDMRKYKSDENNLVALDGLSKLPNTLSRLDSQVPSYMLSTVLHFNYGSIETDGTGGAAFRRMYHRFLNITAEETGNPAIKGAADSLKFAVEAWTQLAMHMKDLSGKKSVLKNQEQRFDELSRLAELAETVYESEKLFYDYIMENI